VKAIARLAGAWLRRSVIAETAGSVHSGSGLPLLALRHLVSLSSSVVYFSFRPKLSLKPN